MASNLYSASADLGMGMGDGDLLQQQVADSEEERKKKLLRGLQPDLMNTTASSMLLGPAAGVFRA